MYETDATEEALRLSHCCIVYELRFDSDHMPIESTLFGISYIGQAVRVADSAEALLEARFREHVRDAESDPKEVGLRAALRIFGVQAVTKHIVSFKKSDAASGRSWANALEKAEIALRGGHLIDFEPLHHIEQTLNLTSGGHGCGTYYSMQANCTLRWNAFVRDIDAFVQEYGHANPPREGAHHALARKVNCVRNGMYLKAWPELETERRLLLESKPGWSWNMHNSAWNAFCDAPAPWASGDSSAGGSLSG